MKISLLKRPYLHKISLTIIFSLSLLSAKSQQETVTLSGRILDETSKETIIGAVVEIKSLKDTSIVTNTTVDIEGNFKTAISNQFPIFIRVSAFGYITKQIDIYELPENTIEIQLHNNNILNEIVVVGYGTQKKEDVVGAISKIDPATTKTIPEAGFDSQLAGKAAGVQISNTSGVPGSDVFVRVRGTTSINAGNDPLYVIDGVFVNNSSLQNIAQDRATSPLTDSTLPI